jgi:hypothetical protein
MRQRRLKSLPSSAYLTPVANAPWYIFIQVQPSIRSSFSIYNRITMMLPSADGFSDCFRGSRILVGTTSISGAVFPHVGEVSKVSRNYELSTSEGRLCK